MPRGMGRGNLDRLPLRGRAGGVRAVRAGQGSSGPRGTGVLRGPQGPSPRSRFSVLFTWSARRASEAAPWRRALRTRCRRNEWLRHRKGRGAGDRRLLADPRHRTRCMLPLPPHRRPCEGRPLRVRARVFEGQRGGSGRRSRGHGARRAAAGAGPSRGRGQGGMSEPPALDGGAAGDLLPPAPGSAPGAGGSLRRQPKQRSRDPALRKVSARLACAGEERRARAEQDGTARWQGLRGRTVGSTRRRRAVGRGGAVRPAPFDPRSWPVLFCGRVGTGRGRARTAASTD